MILTDCSTNTRVVCVELSSHSCKKASFAVTRKCVLYFVVSTDFVVCVFVSFFFWGGVVTLKLDGLTLTLSKINQIHLHVQTQTLDNFLTRVLQLQCFTATPVSHAACQNIALAGINSMLRKLSQE